MTAQPMNDPRYLHTATLLGNGQVLVVGGFGATFLQSSELYDPAQGTWTLTTPLNTARDQQTATLLGNGKVLVAGGFLSGAPLASVEAYALSGPLGGPCGLLDDCQAGLFCVDGVCCDTACTNPCSACSAAKKGSGSDGTCGVMAPGAPEDECLTEAPETCGSTGLCDGAGACRKYSNGILCAPATCMGNTAVNADLCDGKGNCIDGGTQSCPGGCLNGVCQSSCSSDLECSMTTYCDGKSCVAKQPNGSLCSLANRCLTGFCVDGVCCDTACDGDLCDACSKAAGAPEDGTCAPLNGVPCDDGDVCTRIDVCQARVCTGTDPVLCTADICQKSSTCDPLTGACIILYKLDGAPCEGGKCIAGGCLLDTVLSTPDASASISSSSGTTGMGSAGGAGAAPGDSDASPGDGASGSGGSAGGKGGSGERSDIQFRGGACSAGGSDGGGGALGLGLGLGLGLLLSTRRRRRAAA